MNDDIIMRICSEASSLGLTLSPADLDTWAVDNDCDTVMLCALERLFSSMEIRERSALGEDLKKRAWLSRIRDYTFENYAVGHLSDSDRQKMLSLKTLAFMDARRNIVLLGPDGTGKSHIPKRPHPRLAVDDRL